MQKEEKPENNVLATAPATLRDRWDAMWNLLEASPRTGLFETILSRYDESHRHYHTAVHLQECLDAFDLLRDLCRFPGEVEFAIWFHDAIYNSARSDNEELSAELALKSLEKSGGEIEGAHRIHAMILGTRHHSVQSEKMALLKESDCGILMDCDLRIFSESEERFSQYEHQVRKEFFSVNDAQFYRGRLRVLENFYRRNRIYQSKLFYNLYEEKARNNLEKSIASLKELIKQDKI
jgi:predicted metal-dependent HD superfamily phosphohydrolase